MGMVLGLLLLATPPPDSPAYYLYHGDVAMSSGEWRRAIEFFDRAVSMYNSAASAKAMAYWNMHIAYERLGDVDGAPESLLGFIVHTLDYLDFLKELEKEDRRTHNVWVKRFRVRQKLNRAAYKIQQYWEHRNERQASRLCSGCDG